MLGRWVCLSLAVIALTSSASGTKLHGVVVDPKYDDPDLVICNSTKDCSADRTCEPDPNYDDQHVCLHSDLFPLTGRSIAGGAVLLCAMTLAASAGIGGGGLNVPVLMIIFNFTPKEATVLSNSAVFGNTLSQFVINLRRPQPNDASKPLVDFVAVLMLTPAQLGGGNIGVILETILPASLLVLLSILVLAMASVKTFKKGYHMYLNERGTRETSVSFTEPAGSRLTAELLINTDDGLSRLVSPITPGSPAGERDSHELDAFKESRREAEPQKIQYPRSIIAVLAAFWVTYAFDFILQSETFYSFKKCSAVYWIQIFALVPLIVVATLWNVKKNAPSEQPGAPTSEVVGGASYDNRNHSSLASMRLGENQSIQSATTTDSQLPRPRKVSHSSDVNWAQIAAWVPFAACVVGILSALLGLGGGELMGPLLLSIGMEAQRSSATTSTTSMLSAGSNLVHYIVNGYISPDPGFNCYVFLCGLCGGTAGRIGGLYVAKNLGRPSFIVLALGTILLVSFASMVYELSTEEVDWSTHPLC